MAEILPASERSRLERGPQVKDIYIYIIYMIFPDSFEHLNFGFRHSRYTKKRVYLSLQQPGCRCEIENGYHHDIIITINIHPELAFLDITT